MVRRCKEQLVASSERQSMKSVARTLNVERGNCVAARVSEFKKAACRVLWLKLRQEKT